MRNKDDHKELLIRKKAIEMIVKEGFDGLSMKKLAQKVGISASTIYIYFKNREDLLMQLYMGVQERFQKEALAGFSPDMSFEEGLWLQWKNRFKHVSRHPLEFQFYEQFRNSPLINHKDIRPSTFVKMMNDFVEQAAKRGEIRRLSPELFWAVAYGPFYTLVKFHVDGATMAGNSFSLTEQKLRQAFDLVLLALTK